MATIFTRLMNGEIPCYKIAEDENYFAFLDINPLKKGHALVIPKVETDYIFDIEDDALAGMMIFAKKIGRAIESLVPCKRMGIVVIGLEVPHAHIHLIPLEQESDIYFSNKRVHMEDDEFRRLAEDIANKMI